MTGGCGTCKHSWGEESCKGCFWDGKSQENTHWEPKEPFINKPCVSEQACREDTMKVLEKIKSIVAEWKADTWTDNLSYECMVKIAKLVEPRESEGKE